MPFEITFGNLQQGISADFVPVPSVDADFETYIGGGIIPTGEIEITENGTHDVTQYATARVSVPGITPTGTKQVTVTSNGVTTEDVEDYAAVEISANVPNTYAASDEGKVVDNGALVTQGSQTYSSNGNYDTTKIKSITVAVPGSTGTKQITISSNGTTTEDVAAYADAEITVAVPASAVDSGTKTVSINANGTTVEDVVGYANAQIVVAVPVPVLDALTATDNGTYTPTPGHAYSSVVVAIPSASGVSF